jgi:hypothetical protein
VQPTCVTVPDELFDCRSLKPRAPDPATASQADVARFLLRQDAALDLCASRAEAAREILAARRCKPAGQGAAHAP